MSIGDFPESLSRAMLVGCNVSREIGRSTALAQVFVAADESGDGDRGRGYGRSAD